MNRQHAQKIHINIPHAIGNLRLWLALGILLFIVSLAINNAKSHTTYVAPPIHAQAVPESAVQGVAGYLRAHSYPSTQVVPERTVQSVADYIRFHSNPFVQTEPEAAVESVTDYLRLHSIGNITNAQGIPNASVQSVTDYLRLHGINLSITLVTDPAVQSVMDYLEAHGE